MIDLDALGAKLADITGDAAKLAIAIAVIERSSDAFRADAAWRSRVSRHIALTPAVIENCLRELADAQVIDLARRVEVTRRCHTPDALSRSAAVPHSALPDRAERSEAKRVGESANRERTELAKRSDAREQQLSIDAAQLRDASDVLRSGPKPKRQAKPTSLGDAVAADIEAESAASRHNGDVRAAIDVFDRHFAEANNGAKPKWDGRAFNTMSALVKASGRDEVIKRIEIMFVAPPRWPAPPYDLQTLSLHFDKFAQPANGRGGMVDRWRGGENYYGEVTNVEVPDGR